MKPLVILPDSLLPERELNPSLRRLKASCAKKWRSFRSSVRLWELSDIIAALMALERIEEAIELEQWVYENVSFQGDYEIWSPVECLGCTCCIGLLRLGDSARASEWMRHILQCKQAKTPSIEFYIDDVTI